MFRILFILGLFFAGDVLAAESDDNVERYRAYFKSLDLPYIEPRGCSADAPCTVTGDFNNDGVQDLAALYEYSGDQSRRARWNVDLVFVYSQEGSNELMHQVFSHIGQVDAKTGAVSTSVAIQGKGKLKTPGGDFPMEWPGVNVFYGPNRGPAQYLTFYWRGERFYSLDKSDD